MTFDGNGPTEGGNPGEGQFGPDGGPGPTGNPSGAPQPAGGRAAARKAAKAGPGRRTGTQSAAGPDAGAPGTPPAGGRAAARRGAAGGKLTKAAKRKRILKYTAMGVGFVVVASVGGGYLYVQELNSNIRKGALNNGGSALAPESKPNAAGQTPLNILMIGSDGRTSADDCKLGGSCDGSAPHADTEMLVHLSADRSNASIMSIPRDTQADIPACTNPTTKAVTKAKHDIITDSLNVGDAGCVVDTWEKLTKIHIDHYMMVDFAGVVNMADAIGGVDVCTKENVMDYQPSTDKEGVFHQVGSHLELPAGTHSIKGEQALEWLRTRHAFGDGTDLGRAQAQHLYINSMIRELKSAKTLANPLKLNDLAQAATKALTVDNGLGSVNALASLALDLNKVPTNRITTVTAPTVYQDNPANPDAAFVVTTPDSFKLFQMIAADVPLDRNAPPPTAAPADPATSSAPVAATSAPAPSPSAPAAPVEKSAVRVTVQNASGASGRSTAISDALTAQGYTHATLDPRTAPKSPTKLLYPAAEQAQAKAVAASLGLPDSVLSESTASAHLTLLVGTDWTSGTSWPSGAPGGGNAASPAAAPPAPTAMPTAAVAQNAQDDANQCMDVNPSPYHSFKDGQSHYIYSWTGPNAPNVPQP